MQRKPLKIDRIFLRLVVLACLYCILAVISLKFGIVNSNVTIFWPAGGLGLAALLLWGKKFWPGIFLGSFASGLIVGDSVWVALIIAFGNTLESVFGCWLLSRAPDFDSLLTKVNDFFKITTIAVISSCLSAIIGSTTLYIFGIVAAPALPEVMLHWWQGDTLGIVLVASFVLTWQHRPAYWTNRSIPFFLISILAGQIIFLDWLHAYIGNYAWGYWMYLIVGLAAIHFGRHGALLAALICTTQALLGAALGIGFFGRDFENTHLLNFWTYTLVLTFLGFYLSAIIEEQIRIYQSLKISRNRHQSILIKMMDAYFRLDTDGRILETNPAMSLMTGYSLEELLSMNVSEIEVIESHEETQQHIQKILKEGHDLFESKHRRKDGKIIDVEISSYLSSDDVLNVYAFHRDITERKRFEHMQALEASRLKSLLDTASDGIHVMDLSGNLVQFSNAFCSMLGYSLDETKKLNILDWDCRFSEAEIFNAFEKLPENPISFETKHRRKDGSTFDVEINTRKIFLDGQCYIYASSRDITERKQVAQALYESRNLLKAIIDSAPVRVFWKDKELRYLGCNPAFAKDAGVAKPEDLIGKRDTELAWKEQAELYQADDRQVMDSGVAKISFDEPQTTPDGEEKWLRTSKVSLLNHDFETIGVLGIYEDITAYKLNEKALRESELRMQAILDNSPYLIWLKDPDGRFIKVNKAFITATSLPDASQIIGKTDLDVWPKELAEQYRADDREVITSRQTKFVEAEQIANSGCVYWAETIKTPIFDQTGNLCGTVGFSRDITERMQAAQQLQIAATIFESQEGMLVTDANSLILRVNHAFTLITGYTDEEVIGHTPRLLSSGRQDSTFYAEMWDSINSTGAWEGEIWNRRKSGEVYPEHLAITSVKNVAGVVTNYVATLTDITMSKAASDEIKSLAFYDPLTNLPNRRLLIDRLQQALIASTRSGQHGALLFLDLDHFKILNDTLGHDIGDLLLQLVAERLAWCVREGDTVARIGGDEFVILMEGLGDGMFESAAHTEAVANKILSTLNQVYQLGSHEYYNSPSIGATLFSDHEVGIEDLLRHADIAMYDAKKAGRNTLRFFDPLMQEAINVRADMTRELRNAIAQHQLQLYYQIQVDSADRPVGAEALIRWFHPERGMISPFNFIPLAEETGLILPIGQWVLETACAQLKAWEQDAMTRGLTLSVNVSAKQFNQPDFVSHVLTTIQKYGINASLLKLELTESIIIAHVDHIIITMVALEALGIRFELDDFGTGYSSLQYLKQLPIHQLKIDQSFVRDITSDSSDRKIVRTIIMMANSLELQVIAEGVETEEQRQILLDNGCTNYQGYLFGKPVPVGEFEAALKLS